jgi:hypothetical protein
MATHRPDDGGHPRHHREGRGVLMGESRATWAYGPNESGPGTGTYWRATIRTEDGRIRDDSGIASSPRKARRAIRRALKRAERAKP